MFKGYANYESTKKFLEQKIKEEKIRKDFVSTFCDVLVSQMAIGTYLGPMDHNTDMAVTQAIFKVVTEGINFIDTAINYRGQRAEKSVGEALKRLFLKGIITREQIFISSKAGFVPFEFVPTNNIKALFEEQYVKQGITKLSDLIAQCHCMEPKFILNQLEKSRKNLNLETIDLYYLHNPETQLEEITQKIFYEKLFLAFCALENAVKEGKIKAYGLATWDAFRDEPTSQYHVELEKCLATAVRASKEVGNEKHSFKAIQLPLNLAMVEASILPTQNIHSSILETKVLPAIAAAKELGLSVATSAPLLQGRLAHNLPDFIINSFPEDYSQAHCALAFSMSFPEVDAVMVGMKNIENIEHNLSYLKKLKLTKEQLENVLSSMMEN
jgi:aryl-alcohol dehydrogenase-like predicted oxidoreductase